MNDFLFRALTAFTREWVYGYPIRGVCNTQNLWMMYIPAANPGEYSHAVFIDETTLGMWTGLQDENGKKIFHGDIGVLTVFDHNGCDYQYNVEVIFDDACGLCFNEVPLGGFWSYGYDVFDAESQFEIIGNRWDNPELLEGGKQ